MRYKAHTHQDLKTLLNDLPTSYQGPALLIVKAVNLCSSAQTVTSLTHLNRHSVQKLVCSPAHGKSCVSFTVSAALTWLIDSTLCVCVYTLGCLCVCLLSDKQQKSFQIQIQSCKTDDGEFAGEKNVKVKKGHRRERGGEKISHSPI